MSTFAIHFANDDCDVFDCTYTMHPHVRTRYSISHRTRLRIFQRRVPAYWRSDCKFTIIETRLHVLA